MKRGRNGNEDTKTQSLLIATFRPLVMSLGDAVIVTQEGERGSIILGRSKM